MVPPRDPPASSCGHQRCASRGGRTLTAAPWFSRSGVGNSLSIRWGFGWGSNGARSLKDNPRKGALMKDAATEQVPRFQWERFLHDFTEFNLEMPVRIQVISPGTDEPGATGYGLLAENQPLLDVTLDDEMGAPVVVIECGGTAAPGSGYGAPSAMRHVIRNPIALRARRTGGAPSAVGWDALEIEAPENSVILSLGPHPASAPSREDARKELLQAGARAKRAR
jgi:hypothetical protein